jgi:hypothetical protein
MIDLQLERSNMPALDGYMAELDYTSGYYRYLSPAFLRFAVINRGIPFPSHQPLRYLELGFGKGLSLNIHAAAYPGEYWGTDINLSHLDFAKKLADASGVQVRMLGLSVAEVAQLEELPEFDVIVAHGLWSWISDGSRRAIIELLGRKLVAGGIFYVSYNALPGCAALIPVQQLLRLHSEVLGPSVPILDRLSQAFAFAKKLKSVGSAYFDQTPRAVEWLEEINNKNPVYLCHEYLGENWRAMSFAETAAALSGGGLQFVGSADLTDHDDGFCFSPEGSALLRSIEEPMLRETVRDTLLSQEFRRDIYIKGENRLARSEQHKELIHTAFMLLVSLDNIPKKMKWGNAELDLDSTPYKEVLIALSEDSYRRKTLAELDHRFRLKHREIAELIRMLVALTRANFVAPVLEVKTSEQATLACLKLNSEILRQSQGSEGVDALASPVTGQGVTVPHVEQLFLHAIANGLTGPNEWASFAWKILASRQSDNRKRNQSLEGAKLLKHAMLFSNEEPIFRALGVL